MSDSTAYARTSPLARASHGLGVLALFMLVLSGCWILKAVDRSGLQGQTQENVIGSLRWAVLCQGTAGVAGLAALVLGIIALVDVGRGAGRVQGRGQAVSGLVTGTLTVLTLALVYGVLPLIATMKAPKLESSNNLKVLGLAMVEYHEAYRRLPPAVPRDPELGHWAQPYSWRGALLPLLGEERDTGRTHANRPAVVHAGQPRATIFWRGPQSRLRSSPEYP
jgi:hypothetical protein